MKQLFIALLGAGLMSFATQGDYCQGFEDGYRYGYCYDAETEQPDPFCVEPIPPICPIPGINENGYRDGWARGFNQGLNDK